MFIFGFNSTLDAMVAHSKRGPTKAIYMINYKGREDIPKTNYEDRWKLQRQGRFQRLTIKTDRNYKGREDSKDYLPRQIEITKAEKIPKTTYRDK